MRKQSLRFARTGDSTLRTRDKLAAVMLAKQRGPDYALVECEDDYGPYFALVRKRVERRVVPKLSPPPIARKLESAPVAPRRPIAQYINPWTGTRY